jgi:maltooligosyltrehalose trehalohydrolase
VIYELHVGTFTAEGTFEAAVTRLPYLVELGITAVEVMPVVAFPGERNWGYDGVFPFATQESYGGPTGLQRFVDACHQHGLAVVLDVVYNHLGPEGNLLAQFGPYFTDVYNTPWGPAINFDDAHSDEVRRYFLDNAAMWLREFHIDALRLDAVHAIMDRSAHPFLAELSEHTEVLSRETGRKRWLIAESDANEPRLVMPLAMGGLGMDAVWADDFHHAVHARLTGECQRYYEDYGSAEMVLRALRDGFAYRGQYSRFRQRRHGAPSDDASAQQFVICTQNHDQVGNRPGGERLETLVGMPACRLAAALLLLAPQTPLLFMGQEYGERAPFPYFVSHGDPQLVKAVRNGRQQEFEGKGWGDAPDPQDPATFASAKIDLALAEHASHREMLTLYRALLRFRAGDRFRRSRPDHTFMLVADDRVLVQRAGDPNSGWIALYNLGPESVNVPELDGMTELEVIIASGEPTRLPPYGFVLLSQGEPS